MYMCTSFRGAKPSKIGKQGGSGTTSLAWKYIKVCGYSDRFCKNLNQRSLTPSWPLTPHLLRSHVWLYPRIIVSKSHENTLKYVDTVTLFAKTWTKGHWPLDDLWPPHLLRSHVWLYPRIIVSMSHGNTSMYVDTRWSILQITNQRSLTLDDLWPHICWRLMCDSTQGSLCPSPMKIHQSMWIHWPFLQKNLNQRSFTPRWPLTPHRLRLHVWLYPRIIVSKSHENTSKYVDTVNLFAKTWTNGHWSLDDLWPHICWGHMCDSTQGSLCPSPMKIHQSMWIQWPFLQKNLNQRSFTPRWPLTPHLLRSHVWLYPRIIVSKSHGNTPMYVDTVINFANYHIHTHTTYYVHTTYRISDHIVSFWTTFRRDKKVCFWSCSQIL